MKIVISEGCTAFYTSIDGVDSNDVSLPETLDYILAKAKEGILDGTIQLDSLIRIFQYSDYEHDDYVCDSCGDTVNRTIWEI